MKTLVLSAALALTVAGAAAAQPAQASRPPACADDPIFKQMDFVLGEWDVFNGPKADAPKTATVRMEKALKGCTVDETWKALSDRESDGLGLFTYSRILKAWHYFWASDNGGTTYFTGSEIKPGEIRYVTKRPTASGGERLRHWTLSLEPEGRIRELSVGSEDGGKTWTTEYDLWWTKRK